RMAGAPALGGGRARPVARRLRADGVPAAPSAASPGPALGRAGGEQRAAHRVDRPPPHPRPRRRGGDHGSRHAAAHPTARSEWWAEQSLQRPLPGQRRAGSGGAARPARLEASGPLPGLLRRPLPPSLPRPGAGGAQPRRADGAPPPRDVGCLCRGRGDAGHLRAPGTAGRRVRAGAAVAARESELARERERAGRRERLASLATLAAGTAHALGTPLATIAVAARELERRLASLPDAAEDARLIQLQIARCREALARMSAESGQSPGEALHPGPLSTLLEEALEGLPEASRVEVEVPDGLATTSAALPVRALGQSVQALVRNALQASTPESKVVLRLGVEGSRLHVTVED